MASSTSSSLSNLPYQWRRKPYASPDHTITEIHAVDATSAPSVVVNPTTGPSTGLSTHHNLPQNKVDVGVQTESVQVPTGDNSHRARCQEVTPSSMLARPTVMPIGIIDVEQLAAKLSYMQRRAEEMNRMKQIANGEQAEEKENVVPAPRPSKRKRSARPAPDGPVRRSRRLNRGAQGRETE